MAKQHKKYEFTGPAVRQSKYDWGKYLNGTIWELTVGEDIEIDADATDSTRAAKKAVNQFLKGAKHQAALKGQGIKYQKVDGGVVIQCTGVADQAKADAYNATRKEKKAAKKAAKKAKAETNGHVEEAEVDQMESVEAE